MTESVHVVFGDAAAASLRAALAKLGHDERVLALIDDRSLGPIEPGTAEDRARWFRDVLFDDLAASIARDAEAVWAEAAAADRVIAWVSSRCATELFGLSDLVRQRGVASVDVVDVSALLEGWEGASFQVVTEDLIVERGLYASATEVTEFQRTRLLAKWDELRVQNDAVRILESDGPQSYPLEFLDEEILRHTNEDWMSATRLVGEVLSAGGDRLRFVAATMFVISRVLTLLDESVLHADSGEEQFDWASLRVRRPTEDN